MSSLDLSVKLRRLKPGQRLIKPARVPRGPGIYGVNQSKIYTAPPVVYFYFGIDNSENAIAAAILDHRPRKGRWDDLEPKAFLSVVVDLAAFTLTRFGEARPLCIAGVNKYADLSAISYFARNAKPNNRRFENAGISTLATVGNLGWRRSALFWVRELMHKKLPAPGSIAMSEIADTPAFVRFLGISPLSAMRGFSNGRLTSQKSTAIYGGAAFDIFRSKQSFLAFLSAITGVLTKIDSLH